MKEEKRRTPELRFPGFTDDWKQRKLPEFVEFYSGLTYTPDDVRESGTLVLRSSNVKNGEIVDADNVYVDSAKATSDNVQDGDIIVVVRNGSRALIGKHAEIKGDMPNTVIGAFMTGIRSEQSSFVNALLDTSQFENEIRKNLGATINQITGYMLSEMKFYIPSSKEQEQIGSFFTNLDNLITLHQRKLDQMKEYKEGMLQKLFPKKGEKVPELRFPGFTDDWEQRKYSDVIDLLSGQDFEPSGYNDEGNGIPYMTGASCIENGETVVNRWTETPKCLAYKGDVLLVCKGSGYGAIAKLAQEKAHIARQFMALKSKDVLDNTFNYYLAHSVVSDIKKDARGLIAGIARDAVLNELIALPSKEEQKRIGEFLARFDNTITLHQRKLDQMKGYKKGLLQKMFV